jgi:hypothetical protein
VTGSGSPTGGTKLRVDPVTGSEGSMISRVISSLRI